MFARNQHATRLATMAPFGNVTDSKNFRSLQHRPQIFASDYFCQIEFYQMMVL